MKKRITVIGLDDPLAERIKDSISKISFDTNIVLYSSVPTIQNDVSLQIESPSITNRMLDVNGVIYYSYFEGVEKERLTLALSSTPTFPSIRATQPLDNKLAALVSALNADPQGSEAPNRHIVRWDLLYRFLSASEINVLGQHRDCVVKWGNAHCGEGKRRVAELLADLPLIGDYAVNGPIYIEPFIQGESIRILIVGERAWQLHYTSTDWRKNVRSKVTVVEIDQKLLARTKQITTSLGLVVAGVDYIVPDKGAPVLLEVNAYPGLDDVPGAEDAFVDLAVQWSHSI